MTTFKNPSDFVSGTVWATPSGKRLQVMSEAFVAYGRTWVPMWDDDFEEARLFTAQDLGRLQIRRLS